MIHKAIHCYVSGHVQGVFFRQETKQRAQTLGLVGWVKNLPDGRVEVMASGEAAQVDQLHAWLRHGPTLAHVSNLESDEVEYKAFACFTIRY